MMMGFVTMVMVGIFMIMVVIVSMAMLTIFMVMLLMMLVLMPLQIDIHALLFLSVDRYLHMRSGDPALHSRFCLNRESRQTHLIHCL